MSKYQPWYDMPNGFSLFVEEDEVGGRVYSSDEIGGGVRVWQTSLVSPGTLLFALALEEGFQLKEQQERRTKENDQ